MQNNWKSNIYRTNLAPKLSIRHDSKCKWRRTDDLKYNYLRKMRELRDKTGHCSHHRRARQSSICACFLLPHLMWWLWWWRRLPPPPPPQNFIKVGRHSDSFYAEKIFYKGCRCFLFVCFFASPFTTLFQRHGELLRSDDWNQSYQSRTEGRQLESGRRQWENKITFVAAVCVQLLPVLCIFFFFLEKQTWQRHLHFVFLRCYFSFL